MRVVTHVVIQEPTHFYLVAVTFSWFSESLPFHQRWARRISSCTGDFYWRGLKVARITLAHMAQDRTQFMATPNNGAEYLCAWEKGGGYSYGWPRTV